MPANTVHLAIQAILNGLILPGTAGTLDAFVAPPAQRDDPPPAIYIWPSRATEHRQSLPRAAVGYLPTTQSGWKQMEHTIDGYLTWFQEDSDASVDQAFSSVVDAVMQALRNAPDPVYKAIDPLTGQQSVLFAIGEKMSYEMAPPRATADQRFMRFDALITINVCEAFQA